MHHAGHQTRIPRHPKSLSCTTLAIKLASQDTQKSRSCTTLAIKRASQDIQKVCRAPRWLSNSHPKTPKKSVVHHAGHQTRIPRHPKSLSCITLAIKLASQDTQKVCRALRWPSNSHHKTAKKSVVNHAGHQTRIPRHPKIVHHAGHQTRIPRHPKICRAPCWPSNSHPKTCEKSVVHHAGHQIRIPRHPKSLSCTTLAIKLASQDTQKVCRAPRRPSNSHPKTPKKSVLHHAGHQIRTPRHLKSLSCTTLAIKLASQDTRKVCRTPRWPSNSHPKTPKSLSCTTLAIKLASQPTRAPRWPSNSHPKTPKKSVVHHAGHQTRIPRHPKSLSCTTLAIKLASQDSQKVCRAPHWPSNSHPKTPKKSVVHHAGHQTRIARHPKSLSCTTLAIKLASQDTQNVCWAPRWPSNLHPKSPKKSVVHHAGHQTCIPRHPKNLSCIPRHPKSLSCTTQAIKLASQHTQKVCRAPRWPSNSHPKTPKKSIVHHAGHQIRISRHPKSLSCTTLAIKLPSQDTQKSLSCTTLAFKLASQDTHKVSRAPRWPSNSHLKTPKKSVVHHAGHQTHIPTHPKSLSCTTLAIKLASQDTQKVCRTPRWPSNSHPNTPKKPVVHHAGHQTRIPRHPKSLSYTTLAIKLASQDTQKVCRAPRWPSNSHPKTPKKSVVHPAGHQTRIPRHPKSLSCTTLAIKLAFQKSVVHHACHQTRIPRHPKSLSCTTLAHQPHIPRRPKSLSCTTLAIKLASQDTQKVCRAPHWPSNSHPKTPKKSVVHHTGHQTRIPCTLLAIKLASQDTQKVCRAPRWPSNSYPETPKKSVVHHAGHQTRIPRHPKSLSCTTLGHQTRIPRHPKSLSCTTLAFKFAWQDTQKVCRAPCWPFNSHPKTPKKSVVHHACHQTRIPRHPKSLSCTTPAIKLASQDTQKVCRAPRWPSNSHPKTPKKSVVHHAGRQIRISRHPKSLLCTTLAIKLASQDTQKVCRAPRWPSNSHPRHPKSLSCTTLAIKLASQDTKKSVVHHADHQTHIPRHPKNLSCTTLAIKLACIPRHPKSLSCTTLAIKLPSRDTQKVCRAPRWPSNSHPKTPKKSVMHHAGHQTRIQRHPKSLLCTTLAIKLASQDTQKVCRAPRWPSNSHPRYPKSLSCTTLAIKLASQDTQKVCRVPLWPSNLHPKTPKKSVVHHTGHQTRIPKYPKRLSCTTLAIKLTSQDTQKVCRAPRWPSNSHPKHPKSLSCTTLAIKLASQDTQKVCRAPRWPSNSHPKTPKSLSCTTLAIPTHPKSLSCTTLAIKLTSHDTQKVCRAPCLPSNSHPKTPKKSVVHHTGHQPKSLSCTTLVINLASQDTQKFFRAPRWPSNWHDLNTKPPQACRK